MGKTVRIIIRKSIFTFLQNYQYFTSTPALLAFPFAVTTLLSQPLISSSRLFPLVHARLRFVFLAAGFPPSSQLFAILNLKLSQTILTFLFVSPFTLSFLLLAKASILKFLQSHKPSQGIAFSHFISLFKPLLVTQLCNSLVILSTNATCFCIFLLSFNIFNVLGLTSPVLMLFLSSVGAIFYSVILANSYIICNLALILSGQHKHGGFTSIIKACGMIQGRNGTALSLAVPINMALAATEALFQYRVVKIYNNRALALSSTSRVMEGMLIAYLYVIQLILDTIVGSVFLESCRKEYQKIDQGDAYNHAIQVQDRNCKTID